MTYRYPKLPVPPATTTAPPETFRLGQPVRATPDGPVGFIVGANKHNRLLVRFPTRTLRFRPQKLIVVMDDARKG